MWKTLDYGIHDDVTTTNYVITADYTQSIANRATPNHARDFCPTTVQNCLNNKHQRAQGCSPTLQALQKTILEKNLIH